FGRRNCLSIGWTGIATGSSRGRCGKEDAMIHRWICCLALGFALSSPLASAAEPLEFGSPSAVLKASELKGRIVETRDGEELGRVQDFAIDLASGRIGYVVVSVGSFLIEDSLIAVAPDALRQSADVDGRLVLE